MAWTGSGPRSSKDPAPGDCRLWAVADDGYGRYWIRTPGGQQAVRPQRHAHELLTGDQLPNHLMLMHVSDIFVVRPRHRKSGLTPGPWHPRGAPYRPLTQKTPRQRLFLALARRGRTNFAARSREFRDALKEHGWDESVIRPLVSGVDPDASMLF